MKRTICLMTDWYPTPENTYRGVFFKEQAFAVADQFDFLVVRYRELISFFPWGKTSVEMVREEKNTREYRTDVRMPIWLAVWDELYSLYVKFRGKKRKDGVGKYTSPTRRKFTEKRIRDIFRRKITESVDAFYCVDGQLEAFSVLCAARERGKPFVAGEHGPVPWPGTGISDINQEAMEQANLFLAISQDKIRQLLLQNVHLPRTVYIGNLINESTLRLKEQKETGTKTILIVAAHSFYKNYDMFIRIINRLTNITDVSFRVLVVGYAANRGYAKNTESFEQQIRSSAFADRAELMPEIAHEHMERVYHRADAFVMTSIQEGQPVSAMEAACCGLPIFSTRCGGVEDWVDDSMGRIYAVSDEEGMAGGLKAWLEGEIRFDSEHIREHVVRLFGTQAFHDTFCKAFDEVMTDG